jgi:hypothetical protein
VSSVTIYDTLLDEWLAGAPDRDPASDPAETATATCPVCGGSAVDVVYHSAARDWGTGEYLDCTEYPCPACDGTGRIATPATPNWHDGIELPDLDETPREMAVRYMIARHTP